MSVKAKALAVPLMALCLLAFAAQANSQEPTVTVDWQQGDGGLAPIGNDLAEVALTNQYMSLDGRDTKRLMEWMENPLSGREVATIAPVSQDRYWFLVFEWDPIGYVKDEGHEELDADAILQTLKEGNEAGNEERRRRGWATLDLVGWKTPPFYDSESQNLTWATHLQSGYEEVLNRNIRLLGREGVMQVTLVASPEEYDLATIQANALLTKFQFKPGNKYGEYVAGKDRVAEIGLAALITGGAAAAAVKTGLFARFWKLIAAGAVALFAGAKRFFRRLSGSGASS